MAEFGTETGQGEEMMNDSVNVAGKLVSVALSISYRKLVDIIFLNAISSGLDLLRLSYPQKRRME